MEHYEGIIISKTPYQERHCISRIILRNGRKISVNFLGGMGGGKKMKSSLIQLGHGVRFSITGRLKEGESLNLSKDYKKLWSPENIRNNHRAFYQMCFYLELLDKISIGENLVNRKRFQDINQDDQGLFNVLSNGIYYLDEFVNKLNSNQNSDFGSLFALFLGKLVFHLGVSPDLENEYFSEIPLSQVKEFQLSFENGAFIDSSKVELRERTDHKGLWRLLNQAKNTKYSDFEQIKIEEVYIIHILLNYLLFQLGFEKKDFKTLEMIL